MPFRMLPVATIDHIDEYYMNHSHQFFTSLTTHVRSPLPTLSAVPPSKLCYEMALTLVVPFVGKSGPKSRPFIMINAALSPWNLLLSLTGYSPFARVTIVYPTLSLDALASLKFSHRPFATRPSKGSKNAGIRSNPACSPRSSSPL